MIFVQSRKQSKMFVISTERDDCCLLTIYAAELKIHSQGTDVASMKNTVFAGDASLVKRLIFKMINV